MQNPILYFTPDTWAKLIYLRDIGETEIGGFGITSTKNRFLITDFALVKQKSSAVTCYFDDNGVGQHFDKYDDKGLQPWQYGRIWIHTHPGSSPSPSTTDEQTFKRWFEDTDYSIMFILARGGDCYCRLKSKNNSLILEQQIEVLIDYDVEFGATNRKEWKKEYKELVSQNIVHSYFDNKSWLDQYSPYQYKSGYRIDTPEDNISASEYDDVFNLPDEDDEKFDEDMCYFSEGKIFYTDFCLGETFEFDPDTDEFMFSSEGQDYVYTGQELSWMKEIRFRYGKHLNKKIPDEQIIDINTP